MRVLSDFDGVLTDITHEAARVTNLFLDALRGTGARDEHAIHQLAHRAYEEMAHDPTRHGWRVGGRITAFANEDGFIRIERARRVPRRASRAAATTPRATSRPRSRRRASRISRRSRSAPSSEMMRETAAGEIKPIDPAAAAVLKALLARGDEVVSSRTRGPRASSSSCAAPASSRNRTRRRVRAAFGCAAARGSSSFRMSRAASRSNGYAVSTDRPHYEEILLEERPDVVVGDVFSLDLALPLEFARRGMIRRRDSSSAVVLTRPRGPSTT